MSHYVLNPVVFVQARAAESRSSASVITTSSSLVTSPDESTPTLGEPEVWTSDDVYGEDGRPRPPKEASPSGEEQRGNRNEEGASDADENHGSASPAFSGDPRESERPPVSSDDVVTLYRQIITRQAGWPAQASSGAGEGVGDGVETKNGAAGDDAEEYEDEGDIFSETLLPKAPQSPGGASPSSPVPPPATELDGPLVYCEICELEVPEDDLAQHFRGTTHMLSRAMKEEETDEGTAKRRVFGPHGLDSSNIGYRLVVQAGWEAEKGLGVEGQGIREPIPTTVRIGRLGIGHKKAGRTAITHATADIKKGKKPKISKQGEDSQKKLTGKQLRRAHERDRAKTKAIMQYLSW